MKLLFLILFICSFPLVAQQNSYYTQDSSNSAKYADPISTDSVVNHSNKSSENDLELLLLIGSFIINIALAYITVKQHLIIVKNEKPLLHSNAFVEIIDKRYYPQNKEQFLQFNSRFYINLVNVGKIPLTDFWIRMPENLSFTSTVDSKDKNKPIPVRFRIFYIDEPILPESSLIVHISVDDFFGNNFSILKDDSSDIEIKYRGINDKKYKVMGIPFNIKHQKENVKFDYKVTFANSLTLKEEDLLPYDESDWDEIK